MSPTLGVGPARDLLALLREHSGALTATKVVQKTGWSYGVAQVRLGAAERNGLALSTRVAGELRYAITGKGASLL